MTATIEIPHAKFSFDIALPKKSVLQLAAFLFPNWNGCAEVKVKQLTEGTTNLLYKVKHTRQDNGVANDDNDVALVKVYGTGSEKLIDRRKELHFHHLLAEYGLGSALVLTFEGGHAYRFIEGVACTGKNMTERQVYLGVAKELARWHTLIPVETLPSQNSRTYTKTTTNGNLTLETSARHLIDSMPHPNVFNTAQVWLDAIPSESSTESELKGQLHKEWDYLTKTIFSKTKSDKMVFGHGDLLSGNIILDPDKECHAANDPESVKFIDYEHCTFCPPAFDIANHFAEWAGFECDYTLLPSRTSRQDFITAYIHGCHQFSDGQTHDEAAISQLMADVDTYRGFPGFYWGLCALSQAAAATSSIDFDYKGYADLRLAEYFAWKDEMEGTREERGDETPLREKMWARDD